MGWLKWTNGTPSIVKGQIWSFLINLPALYSLPSKKRSISLALFASITHYIASINTDSVGSAWCFYNGFISLFFLADYLWLDSGDEEPVKVNKTD